MRRKLAPVVIAIGCCLLVLAACGGEDGEDSSATSAPAPLPADENEGSGGSGGPDDPPGGPNDFVGLALDDAVALAEEQGRPWRIGREDDEFFALTQDYVLGRVTFEIDEGLVSMAFIEGEEGSGDDSEPPPPGGGGPALPEDPSRSQLLGAAISRMVKTDNSFGGGEPFARIEIATGVGEPPSAQLTELDRELIAAEIEDVARVEFVPSAEEAIEGYSGRNAMVAVVSVGEFRIDDDRAEVDLALWCGDLCGVFLTYEAELVDGTWRIIGTTGPIAVS